SQTILVVGKSYHGIGSFLTELEFELIKNKFVGKVLFDLLLSNGINSSNRFMFSRFKNNRFYEPKIIESDSDKRKCENYSIKYFRNNPSILSQGILFQSDIYNFLETN